MFKATLTNLQIKLVTSFLILQFSPAATMAAAVTGGGGSTVATSSTFRLFPSANSCPESEILTCWIGKVFGWSQSAILLLATVVIVMAGLIYMTSAGNEKQIALAKKLILGALSGVAVIVLGKFFLTVVIGVPWL